MRGWCWGSFGGGAGGTVVGEMSESFWKLDQGVSRGSWGEERGSMSGSETVGRRDGETVRE